MAMSMSVRSMKAVPVGSVRSRAAQPRAPVVALPKRSVRMYGALDDAMDKAKEAVGITSDKAEGTAKDVKREAGKAADRTSANLSSGQDKAARQAERAGDAAGDAADDAGSALKRGVKGMQQNAADPAGQVRAAAEDVGDTIATNVERAKNTVSDKVEDAKDRASN